MAKRPAIAIAVSFSLGFFHKSKNKCIVFGEANICNGEYKGLANPCVNEEQNAFVLVLHKEARNTQKHTEKHTNTHKNTQNTIKEANQCIES